MPSRGRSRRCAPRPTPRRSSPRRAAPPARRRRSAPAARSRPSASSTPWPTTSASASGAALRAGAPPAAPPRCMTKDRATPDRVTAAADGSRRRLWSYSGVSTRIAVGRARVAREVRAAAPLMADLRAPVTARGPWLTAVLNAGAARRGGGRPVAVVVGPPQGARTPWRSSPCAAEGRSRSSRCSATTPGRCRPAARRPGCSPGTRRPPSCSPRASATCSARCGVRDGCG